MSNKKDGSGQQSSLEELNKLRAENKRLTQELDLLKHAGGEASSSGVLPQLTGVRQGDKPPVFELRNKKWILLFYFDTELYEEIKTKDLVGRRASGLQCSEYQVGNPSLVVDDTNLKQVVYVYKCRESTIKVKGKVNSIILDGCKRVGVVFDNVVSCIEIVNSQSVQTQVNGKCPTILVDKTDGCQVYLGKDSLDAEIVTAKSSEVNVMVPRDYGDYSEFALPEQFKSVWNGTTFKTDCTKRL